MRLAGPVTETNLQFKIFNIKKQKKIISIIEFKKKVFVSSLFYLLDNTSKNKLKKRNVCCNKAGSRKYIKRSGGGGEYYLFKKENLNFLKLSESFLFYNKFVCEFNDSTVSPYFAVFYHWFTLLNYPPPLLQIHCDRYNSLFYQFFIHLHNNMSWRWMIYCLLHAAIISAGKQGTIETRAGNFRMDNL